MWLTLLRNPVVWAAVAFVVGGALAADYTRRVKNGEIAEIKLEQANAVLAAADQARKEERDAQAAADAVRSQPVVRVRCTAAQADGVPGAGTSPDVGDLRGGDPGGDYGPALRELLAAAIANRKLADE